MGYYIFFAIVFICCIEMWFPVLLDIPLQIISVIFKRKIPLITESMFGSKDCESYSNSGRLIHSLFLFLFIIAFIAIIALGLYGYSQWDWHERVQKENETEELVFKQLNILASQVDEDGFFIKHPGKTLDVKDLWGMPLHVEYDLSLTEQTVKVRSSSFDKKINTLDDITATSRLPRKKVMLLKICWVKQRINSLKKSMSVFKKISEGLGNG